VVWHQTHTQFRGPGTTEDTVTGIPVWPRFALKGIGVAFMTFAVIAMLGGLAQINPVWLYGPFVPYTAPAPAQPDFYVGWLEGLLRLWPNWEFTAFGHTVGELFLPAVVVPGIIFTALALWPFAEARVRRDTAAHHYAQRPREAPVRSGIGAAGITMFIVLMLAGSNDVLAKYLLIEVDTLNSVLLVLLFVLPVVIGLLTFWICRDLGRRGARPIEDPPRVALRRTADGGFDAAHVSPTPPTDREDVP
jgi:ubiquinol-cytochrome c reductase cytochrome b subunit